MPGCAFYSSLVLQTSTGGAGQIVPDCRDDSANSGAKRNLTIRFFLTGGTEWKMISMLRMSAKGSEDVSCSSVFANATTSTWTRPFVPGSPGSGGSDGAWIDQPLTGARQENASCKNAEQFPADQTENRRSLGTAHHIRQAENSGAGLSDPRQGTRAGLSDQ